eukprot:g4547.t1
MRLIRCVFLCVLFHLALSNGARGAGQEPNPIPDLTAGGEESGADAGGGEAEQSEKSDESAITTTSASKSAGQEPNAGGSEADQSEKSDESAITTTSASKSAGQEPNAGGSEADQSEKSDESAITTTSASKSAGQEPNAGGSEADQSEKSDESAITTTSASKSAGQEPNAGGSEADQSEKSDESAITTTSASKSAGQEPKSQFLQKSVKFLADAKWKGTVTEMKKFHSTTSLAVYPSPCDEDTTASLVRHISKELASLYQHSLVSVQLEAAVNVGTEECQVILVSSLDEQLNLTSIERLARNVTRPFRFSRGRRLSSVSISTSISVSEVDPKNLARPGGSLRDQKYQNMADKVMQNAGLIIGVFIGAVALVVAFFYFREDSDKGIKNARRKAKMKRLKTAGSAVSRGAQRSSAFESHPEVLVSIEMSTAVNFKENPMHNPNLSNSRISPVKKILS